MNAVVSLKPMADWSEAEHAALAELSRAVYPPAEAARWSGRHLDWAAAMWGVSVVSSDGDLVSYTGIVVRQATHDGRPVLIGGVGGVKTHPAARGRGYAAMGLQWAVEFFHQQPNVGFALLVCEPPLMEYYARQGWKEFGGRLLTLQNGKTAPFTFNRVMVLDVHLAAPLSGIIDLRGPPW